MAQAGAGRAYYVLAETVSTYVESAAEPTMTNVSRSIHAFREALKVFSREREPALWATAEMQLGDALNMAGERNSEVQKFDEAIVGL